MSDILDELDDLADDVRSSMYADDRQTRHELNKGLEALNQIVRIAHTAVEEQRGEGRRQRYSTDERPWLVHIEGPATERSAEAPTLAEAAELLGFQLRGAASSGERVTDADKVLNRARKIIEWNSGPDGINDPGDVLDSLVDLVAALDAGTLRSGHSNGSVLLTDEDRKDLREWADNIADLNLNTLGAHTRRRVALLRRLSEAEATPASPLPSVGAESATEPDESELDALQGEIDELREWQRRVCALLTPEGDRGDLLPELAEEAIRQLRWPISTPAPASPAPATDDHGITGNRCEVPEDVTRVELIDHRTLALCGDSPSGRRFVGYGVKVALQYQDDGRTLKVFVEDRAEISGRSASAEAENA